MPNTLPEDFYRDWKEFSYRANRHFGIWQETKAERPYHGTKDHWELVVMVEGHARIRSGLRDCELQKHDMLLLQPSDDGYVQVNLQEGNRVCRFQVVILSPNDPRSPLAVLPNLCPVPYPDSGRLLEILGSISGMHSKIKSDEETLLGTAYLHDLLSHYVLCGFQQGLFPAESKRIPPWVENARAYIDQHHKTSGLRLEDIAQAVGRAPRTLQHGFKQAYGFSPISYLHQIRVITAKRLIASNPEFTIQYLMSRCGYQNRSQFHRMFVKYVGRSPSAFRTNST